METSLVVLAFVWVILVSFQMSSIRERLKKLEERPGFKIDENIQSLYPYSCDPANIDHQLLNEDRKKL